MVLITIQLVASYDFYVTPPPLNFVIKSFHSSKNYFARRKRGREKTV